MKWIDEPSTIEPYEGFTYLITNELNGMYYIGKKSFWSRRTLKPLKGKKRRRKVKVESDWRDYYGSSNALNLDIERYGKENFTRRILQVYKTKFEVSYYEAKEQFDRGVLYDKNAYNGLIRCRLRRKT